MIRAGQRLSAALDAIPEIQGSGISLMHGGGSIDILRQPVGGPHTGRWICVEEFREDLSRRERRHWDEIGEELMNRLEQEINRLPRAVARALGLELAGSRLDLPPAALAAITTRDRYDELWLSFGLSCGTAVLSGLIVVGSAGLTPATGGLSTVGAVLAWGNAAASSAACGMDTVRLIQEYRRPGSADQLDRVSAYRIIRTGVDVTAFATGVGQLGGDYQTARIIGRAARSGRPIQRISAAPTPIAPPPDTILRAGVGSVPGFSGSRALPILVSDTLYRRMGLRIASVVGNTVSLTTSSAPRTLLVHIIELSS
jgi:hypothetical protein